MTQNPCYAPVPSSVKHPATYTESFIPKFAELLFGCANVLDPFGGVGKKWAEDRGWEFIIVTESFLF